LSEPGIPQRWYRARRPFVLPMTVVPADIDEQGIASNVAVVAWMNRAAIAHSTALGFDWVQYRRMGAMFVVRRHEIDYLRPARAWDELELRTWPGFMKAATAHRHHEIRRRADGETVARGTNVWAFVDAASGRPLRMPEELLRAFEPRGFV